LSAFSKAVGRQIALGRSIEIRPLRHCEDGSLVGMHLRLLSVPDDPAAPREDRYVSNDLLVYSPVAHDRALAECVEHMGVRLSAALGKYAAAHD
jgi:hypothetical protein